MSSGTIEAEGAESTGSRFLPRNKIAKVFGVVLFMLIFFFWQLRLNKLGMFLEEEEVPKKGYHDTNKKTSLLPKAETAGQSGINIIEEAKTANSSNDYGDEPQKVGVDSEENVMEEKEVPITMCIDIDVPGGYGNKLYSLTMWIAIARASGRKVAVTGKATVWRPFWESEFSYYDGPCPVATPVLCDTKTVATPNSACAKAMFETPHLGIQVTANTNHGLEFEGPAAHPLFLERYKERVQQMMDPTIPDAWFDKNAAMDQSPDPLNRFRRAIYMAIEYPTILHKPTPAFAALISEYEAKHELSSQDAAPDNRFPIHAAIHIRKCVDCGWLMERDQIRDNVKCFLDQFNGSLSDGGSKVFITSDSRDTLDTIMDLIPSGVTVLENIPKAMIHTTKSSSNDFATQAMPYLDNYLLGRAQRVASCWTSYGYAALRTAAAGNIVSRLDSIYLMRHVTSGIYNTPFQNGTACRTLLSIMPP